MAELYIIQNIWEKYHFIVLSSFLNDRILRVKSKSESGFHLDLKHNFILLIKKH